MLGHFGDGRQAPCQHCGSPVTFETMEVDRWIIGGKYVRANVVPSCKPCNRERSDNRAWVGCNPQPLPGRPTHGPGSYWPQNQTEEQYRPTMTEAQVAEVAASQILLAA
jgi:hypothetical protein